MNIDTSISSYRNQVAALPIQAGDTIRIKKGAQISSMHPQQPNSRLAGRAFQAKVHRVEPVDFRRIGEMIISKDSPRDSVCPTYDVRYFIKNEYYSGHRFADTKPEDYHLLFTHPERVFCFKETYEHGKFFTVVYAYIVSYPQVWWAGSGGYWNSTEMEMVTKVVEGVKAAA